MTRTDTIRAVANAYRAALRAELDPLELDYVDTENERRPDGALYCREHDILDANVLMLTAYEAVTGQTIDEHGDWLDIVNPAWALALTKPYGDASEV